MTAQFMQESHKAIYWRYTIWFYRKIIQKKKILESLIQCSNTLESLLAHSTKTILIKQ